MDKIQTTDGPDKCEYCNGDGYTAEHDPGDPHIDGQCSNCPIQVECEKCEGTGHKLKLPDGKQKI